jgi:hypothetical protein
LSITSSPSFSHSSPVLHTTMSHDPTFGLQSSVATQSHTTPSSQVEPSSLAIPYVQPVIQQANKPQHEKDRPGPGPANYHIPQSNPQLEWLMETLYQETSRHNETRMTLQSTRKINFQLEQLLYQERSFNHALRVNLQDAEMKRISTEDFTTSVTCTWSVFGFQ